MSLPAQAEAADRAADPRSFRTGVERVLLQLERFIEQLDHIPGLMDFDRESAPRIARKAAVVRIQQIMSRLDALLAQA